jgi:hypothetical protein
VRGVQASPAQVHAGVRVRALLPARQPGQVRKRAPGVRRQQRVQAPQRAPARAAGGRRQLARLRGRRAPPRPRLRLRLLHLRPPAQDQAGARRARRRAQGARGLHRARRIRCALRRRAAAAVPPPRRRCAVLRRRAPRLGRDRPRHRAAEHPRPRATTSNHGAAAPAPPPPAAAGRRGGGRQGAGLDDEAAGRGLRPRRSRQQRRSHGGCRAAGRCVAVRGRFPLPAAAATAAVAGADFGGADLPNGAVSATVVVGPVSCPGVAPAARGGKRRGWRRRCHAAGVSW